MSIDNNTKEIKNSHHLSQDQLDKIRADIQTSISEIERGELMSIDEAFEAVLKAIEKKK